MSARVLVAFATKAGSTREIAEVVGEELRALGLTADVRPVDSVEDVHAYDAVLLGSAVYFGQWRPEALRFGERFARELRERPVWMFDSGPLNDSPDSGRTEPVVEADALGERIGSRPRMTFGGRLFPDSAGFLTRRIMASGKAGTYGDHRNLPRVRTWARGIGSELVKLPGSTRVPDLSRAESRLTA